MRYALVRRDRPGRAYQAPFLDLIVYGGGIVRDDTDTSGDVDIRDVKGNVIVFDADRETVEDFHRNDPYTLEDMFEFAFVERLWQRVPEAES